MFESPDVACERRSDEKELRDHMRHRRRVSVVGTMSWASRHSESRDSGFDGLPLFSPKRSDFQVGRVWGNTHRSSP